MRAVREWRNDGSRPLRISRQGRRHDVPCRAPAADAAVPSSACRRCPRCPKRTAKKVSSLSMITEAIEHADASKSSAHPSDRRNSRDRSAQPPMLDLIDAARSRRNGQPKAWQEWPCDAVAALPPVGEARRRADAGTAAPEGEISGLHPRAVFPQEGALTRRFWRVAMPLDRAELGVPASFALAATYTREVGVGVDRIWETCSIGSTCRHCTRHFDQRSAGRNRQLGLAGRAHESSGTASGYGAAGRLGERAVLRTHLCGQRCRSRNLDFAGGARTAADAGLVV